MSFHYLHVEQLERASRNRFFAGRTVFLRVDTNTTLAGGKAKLNERIFTAARAIRRLAEQNEARVIVGTHNGRKGEPSYVGVGSILHSLRESVRGEIRYIGNTYSGDTLNKEAIKEILRLENGQALLLENLRFLPGETSSPVEDHSSSEFVRDLIDECKLDYFISDAFSIAHRPHRSVVGFRELPCIAGPNLHADIQSIRELKKHFGTSGKPTAIFILGGTKVQDYFSLIETSLRAGTVKKVFTGGLLANLCLVAKGLEVGEESKGLLKRADHKGRTIWDYLPKVSRLLHDHPDVIETPVDVAGTGNGPDRVVHSVDSIPKQFSILDLGDKTIAHYKSIIDEAVGSNVESEKTLVYIKGPVGAYDLSEQYAFGSGQLLSHIVGDLKERVFTVVGGGDTTAMLRAFRISRTHIDYVNLAGGALVKALAGEPLPGLEVLEASYNRFGASILKGLESAR